MSNSVLTASAPGKLLLFGDHAVVYGFPCIVTAVDQRITVRVELQTEPALVVHAQDVEIHGYIKKNSEIGEGEIPKSVAFIESLYKIFLKKYPQTTGINVTSQSQFSAKFGFGSSSAVTVAFAKALAHLYGITLDNQQLFELCYQTILRVQGVGSGFDIAAAIWGGTLYYVTPAKVVRQLDVRDWPLVVGYTGIKADTATLIKMVAENPERMSIFTELGSLTEKATLTIKQKNWQEVGNLMKHSQELLRQLHVSSPRLETLITSAEDAGSFGAKLSGAGGGDCMIAVVDENLRQNVIHNIENSGGQVFPVRMNAEGVRIEMEQS